MSDDAIVDELDVHTDDVLAALAYVKALPDVDPRRVVLTGCSFGGIVSLLAAERSNQMAAAIDFSGGAMMWSRSAKLRRRLSLAARNARAPVLFLQAANDFSTEPTRVLANEMASVGKPSRARIFPPHGQTAHDGHAFCTGSEAPAWGSEVLDFLQASFSSGDH